MVTHYFLRITHWMITHWPIKFHQISSFGLIFCNHNFCERNGGELFHPATSSKRNLCWPWLEAVGNWENSVPSNQTWLNGGFNWEIIQLNGGFSIAILITRRQYHQRLECRIIRMCQSYYQKWWSIQPKKLPGYTPVTLYIYIYTRTYVELQVKPCKSPASSSKLRTSSFHQIQREFVSLVP